MVHAWLLRRGMDMRFGNSDDDQVGASTALRGLVGE